MTVNQMRALGSRPPGHFVEARFATWLAPAGGTGEAQAFVATQAGDASAAPGLREASCIRAASQVLGLLATQLRLIEEAVRILAEATMCTEGVPSLVASDPAHWSLRRDGEDWLLQAGPEHARLRDSRGLHYLRALLAAPRSEISALDLVAGGRGLAPSGTGPPLDAAARTRYRQRIRELDEQLAAADRAGDPAAAEQADLERQALITELRRATGLAGRPRLAGADAERARINAARTLRATIDRITMAAPIAGAHLCSSVRTGARCRYQPAPGGPARWYT